MQNEMGIIPAKTFTSRMECLCALGLQQRKKSLSSARLAFALGSINSAINFITQEFHGSGLNLAFPVLRLINEELRSISPFNNTRHRLSSVDGLVEKE